MLKNLVLIVKVNIKIDNIVKLLYNVNKYLT